MAHCGAAKITHSRLINGTRKGGRRGERARKEKYDLICLTCSAHVHSHFCNKLHTRKKVGEVSVAPWRRLQTFFFFSPLSPLSPPKPALSPLPSSGAGKNFSSWVVLSPFVSAAAATEQRIPLRGDTESQAPF